MATYVALCSYIPQLRFSGLRLEKYHYCFPCYFVADRLLSYFSSRYFSLAVKGHGVRAWCANIKGIGIPVMSIFAGQAFLLSICSIQFRKTNFYIPLLIINHVIIIDLHLFIQKNLICIYLIVTHSFVFVNLFIITHFFSFQ